MREVMYVMEDFTEPPEGKIVIFGFPSWGNVGPTVCEQLVKFSAARYLGSIYASLFSDSIFTQESGFSELPSIKFYRTERRIEKVIVGIGNFKILRENPEVHTLCEYLIKLAERFRWKMIIGVESIMSGDEEHSVILTNKELIKILPKHVTVMQEKSMKSLLGTFLGLCRINRIDGIGIFASSEKLLAKENTIISTFRTLLYILHSVLSMEESETSQRRD